MLALAHGEDQGFEKQEDGRAKIVSGTLDDHLERGDEVPIWPPKCS